jgi:L-glyceraldehyde 3-phosphate reductase
MFNRWIEDDLLNVIEEEGIGLMGFSPLAQGLLSNKYLYSIPVGSRASMEHSSFSHKNISKEILECLNGLASIASRRGQSLSQMALAWALRDSRVTSVVIGASSIEQIEENVAALENLSFTPEELHEIDHFAMNHPQIDKWILSRNSG